MTVFKKELKQGYTSFIVWTAAIAFMMVICVLMYPEIGKQITGMNDMFANMGDFTKAFGMDQINFGTLIGYYGVECGNAIGIGCGFYAAYIGITMLSKEEKDRTAEFLLTHPVSRKSVVSEKLFAMVAELIVMNIIIAGLSLLSVAIIGESVDMTQFVLIHFAYLLLQLEIACICFGLSAFIKSGAIGIGLGITAVLYFMNIIANISDKAEFLKYISPFSYTDASTIILNNSLDSTYVIIGMVFLLLGIVLAYVKYTSKDIAG